MRGSLNLSFLARNLDLVVSPAPNTDISSISITSGLWLPAPTPNGKYAF